MRLIGEGAEPAAGYGGICRFGLESGERVVLAGIQCPDQHAYMGAEAWAATLRLTPPGQRVRVRPVLGDSYFDWRMLPGETRAYVHAADGTFMNAELLRIGYATMVEDEGLPDPERLRAAEREARDMKRGLWHEGTPLMRAVRAGDVATVEALLDAGADVNEADPYGYTPLMLAHLSDGSRRPGCDAELIEVLLAHGADVETWGSNDRAVEAQRTFACSVSDLLQQGRSRALVAAARGGPDALAALVHKGFDLNGKSRDGWTPLMVAAQLNDPRAIERLVSAGVDLTQGAGDAFAVAVRRGHAEAISALIAGGADVNSRDRDGRTPFQIAEELRNDVIAAQLRDAGVHPASK